MCKGAHDRPQTAGTRPAGLIPVAVTNSAAVDQGWRACHDNRLAVVKPVPPKDHDGAVMSS